MITIFNLDKEELDRLADEFFRHLEEREKRKSEIMKTKGEDIMVQIYESLASDGHICDEDIAYFPEEYSITSEEYHALFESMIEYAEEDYFYHDVDNPFSNESVYYNYRGELIRLFTMSGQGTITSISMVSKEDLRREGVRNIVDFNAFISSVKNSN